MSFFFDVWSNKGFVIASDVKLTVDGEPNYLHKIAIPTRGSKINCALVVCGVYPENCINYFNDASNTKDSLREIAKRFASKWTKRYRGIDEYSAVHLVGYERIPNTFKHVPQMWYWTNWDGIGYRSKEELEKAYLSFNNPIPDDNHLPWKIKQTTGKFPEPTLEEENSLVTSYLKLYQPIFTWNGDNTFWRSATQAVGSAMNLLWRKKSSWTLEEIIELTKHCFEFLAKVGYLLPESTVGLSPEGDFDLVTVTTETVNIEKWADLPG